MDTNTLNTSMARLENIDRIKSRISDLQTSLNKALPDYAMILQVIHKNLSEDDSLVHLLTEEEIGIIIRGLARKKNIMLVESAVKKNSKSKMDSKVNIADLL